MTDIVGQTTAGIKQTIRDPRILVESVIYDVELTLTLPAITSVTSGLNAMAHAIEGLYADDTNPLIALIAEDGIRALASSLPRLAHTLDDTPRVRMRSTAHGSAAWYSERRQWLCITSSVMYSAARSICPTPRRMRYCCRTPSPTMRRPRRQRWLACVVRSVRRTYLRACSLCCAAHRRHVRFASSVMPGDSLEQAVDLAVSNPYRKSTVR
jgi:hypothetical protein